MPHRYVAALVRAHVRFDVVTLVLLVCVFGIFAVSGLSLYNSLQAGRESHNALCALKAARLTQVNNNREYLSLTHKQRVEKYGEALADIPDSTIEQSIRQLQPTIDALNFLKCE